MALDPIDHAALDRPIWSALTSAQRALAEGGALAKRFPADTAPFAATLDETPAAYAALGALIPANGSVALFTPRPVLPPPSLEIERTATLFQMVASGLPPAGARDPEVLDLGEAHAGEMIGLAELTKPGPFASRTHRLGRYIGIRVDGRLVAMAGERMRLDAYVELSAVCVHPDYRGKGYARTLLSTLMAAAPRQGLVPFLHVFDRNAGAIALYRDMGFEVRLHAHLSVLRHAGPGPT